MLLRSSRTLRGTLCPVFLLLSVQTQAQEAPITRVFTAGASMAYRVHLTVRSELEGQRTEKIGEVTYAVPLTRSAECRISWRTTRRILEIAADGSARVEESLGGFETSPASSARDSRAAEEQDKQTADLAEALHETLVGWGIPRTLRYRESAGGQLSDVGAEAGPSFGEQGAPLLTLWLLRALRPAAALPARPLRIGDRWQEPRTAPMKDWKETSAMESGEWLQDPRNPEAAARLHLVQQIYGQAPATGGEGVQELRFHAESLNTISLQDGGVLAATRSASRDLLRVIGPVVGLPEPPRFRATLSAQVEIEGCDDASCSTTGSSKGASGDSSGSSTGGSSGGSWGGRARP